MFLSELFIRVVFRKFDKGGVREVRDFRELKMCLLPDTLKGWLFDVGIGLFCGYEGCIYIDKGRHSMKNMQET